MSPSAALRRGALSGAAAIGLIGVAAVPARLFGAMRGYDSLFEKATRVLAGAVLDLAAVIHLAAPVVALSTVAMALLVGWLRRRWWQQLGALIIGLPLGFSLWVLTVISQQMKSERGAFPTMFDLGEGGSNASFVGGLLGFIRYDRIWIPALVGVGVAATVLGLSLRVARRSTGGLGSWPRWALGLCGSAAVLWVAVLAAAAGQAAVSNRFSAAALGDPMTGLVESSFDLLMSRGQVTPRELVLQANLPPELAAVGAARIGWPPRQAPAAGARCWPHPHARPLDGALEPKGQEPRGRALVQALEAVSAQLFAGRDGRVAVWQLSLESFRADDVHALNPLAAPDIDPFVNALYAAAARGGEGVLASTRMFQAGVRTAQGLGALTCGVGTLPYNLSFIRDLRPFPMRCAADVLGEAGFHNAFFYGSDVTFDDMHLFLKDHHFEQVVSGAELPADGPKGVWGGATDFSLFDDAVRRVDEALAAPDAKPQFALVMSLSNHSPYTPPEDLPTAVVDRVDQAIKATVNRVDDDDRRRLLTHAYTDTAVARLFAALDERHLAERSLVLLSADHSTGESYVWGPQTGLPDTENSKAQIPFAIAIPEQWLAQVADRPALDRALAAAQAELDAAPLSQNDVPTLVLALLSAHPALCALPREARWHSMGGQVTSPYFRPGAEANAYLVGINGVSELYVLDRAGERIGGYEDSVFLKTRADRYRVTPRLIPVAATLVETMQAPTACSAAH